MNKILLDQEKVIITENTKLDIFKDTIITLNNDHEINVTIFPKQNLNLDIYLETSSFTTINIYQENISLTINYYLEKEQGEIAVYHRIVNTSSVEDNINIYQVVSKTKGNFYHHGINKDGTLFLTVNGYVKKDAKDGILNQENKIITNHPSNVQIKPNLYVETKDVIANHGAYIGGFAKEDIFYLRSRGLSKEDAINLLTKGFLWLE